MKWSYKTNRAYIWALFVTGTIYMTPIKKQSIEGLFRVTDQGLEP